MMHKEFITQGYGFVPGFGSCGNDQHVWQPKSPYSDIPPHSVHAGHDSDGDTIYVGRSNYNGDWLPAKVIPRKNTAYVCWGGQEIPVHTYDVLCGIGYSWQPGFAGTVPPGAVSAGATTSGEMLYVGRGHWQGSLTPGKIHPSHRCLYIPYGGQEVRLDSYEVLIRAPALTWMPSSGSMLPANAIHAGHDSDGDQIYVGRAYHDGDLLPAKVIFNKNCAYVCHGGNEHVKHQFEILCGTSYRWLPASNGHVPPNSVEGGRTSNGEQLYIGRGHHCGSLTPGKIHPSHQCLYIPYGGQEIRLSSYEVLTRM
ncbi:uncharacterized protein LOC129605757 isoform X2 [Condylostylus longicornis]|uniref:uncharacterized protein LOC129605757 isoform X2 n=1 Tax=Condylostylus longicornis TaxID=2530218 RepID=UPI00244DBEA4|nr:uncharacterized protein LOC129605757 isoform X2 [Condylostylus longicornis]